MIYIIFSLHTEYLIYYQANLLLLKNAYSAHFIKNDDIDISTHFIQHAMKVEGKTMVPNVILTVYNEPLSFCYFESFWG